MALIETNPDNPRENWDAQAVDDLVPSIKRHGVIEPIVVRRSGERFVLIAGERRFRAALAAKFDIIPAVIRECDDAEAFTLTLLENLNRRNLNPLERARALAKLCKSVDEGGHSMRRVDAGKLFGRSTAWVDNSLRLLNLPEAWQQKLAAGTISERNARALATYADDAKFLARVERDMTDYPAYYETAALFDESLKKLAENPVVAIGIAKATGRPRTPIMPPPASRAILAPATEVAGSFASGDDERSTASSIDAEALCKMIVKLESLEDLRKIQRTITARINQLDRPKAKCKK